MRTDIVLIHLHCLFLSITSIFSFFKISEIISSESRHGNFLKIFLKSYIKQKLFQKIFISEFFKYPIFLSSAFAVLEIQFINLFYPEIETNIFMFATMALYTILKALYLYDDSNDILIYFRFAHILEGLVFNLLLIMMVFILEKSDNYYIMLGVLPPFLLSIFFEVNDGEIKVETRRLKKQRAGVFIDDVVFELGAYIYGISLLFFMLDKIIQVSFNPYLKILIFIIFCVGFFKGIVLMMKWSMKKKPIHQQMLKFKIVLGLLFSLAFIVQVWNINGQ